MDRSVVLQNNPNHTHISINVPIKPVNMLTHIPWLDGRIFLYFELRTHKNEFTKINTGVETSKLIEKSLVHRI